MTESQRLSSEYWEASAIFDDDKRALAIAIGGLLKKAERKHDIEYVLRELEEGRLEKFRFIFPKISDLEAGEIESCKALAQCRFGKLRGEIEEIEKLSQESEAMSERLAQQEIANIEAMQKTLERIKSNLRNPAYIVPKKIKEIRQNKIQGELF